MSQERVFRIVALRYVSASSVSASGREPIDRRAQPVTQQRQQILQAPPSSTGTTI